MDSAATIQGLVYLVCIQRIVVDTTGVVVPAPRVGMGVGLVPCTAFFTMQSVHSLASAPLPGLGFEAGRGGVAARRRRGHHGLQPRQLART